MSDPVPRVAIAIVTFNAEADIEECLDSLDRLEHRPSEVVVVDCASSDQTLARVRSVAARLGSGGPELKLLAQTENLGFAGGMNVALTATDADWVLSLNADARPEPEFLTHLLPRGHDRRVAAITGRLLRPHQPGEAPKLDACGMRLTRSWRHLDRGSGENDRGQFADAVRVFGGTGAATLFRRVALDDVAVDGEIFLAELHSFREDAELAFRLRERGWEVVYEPTARAYHRRQVVPESRRQLSAAINYHSLKNRYLLRLYHQTWRNLLRTALPTLTREVGILLFVLLRERSSLAAYGWVWRNRHRIWLRRQEIQGRRTVPEQEIDLWFSRHQLELCESP